MEIGEEGLLPGGVRGTFVFIYSLILRFRVARLGLLLCFEGEIDR
jgi:hypothetical protein